MDKLDKDWLTQNNSDFEYKKYILLAYLSQVKEKFDNNEIYPYLGELIEHYRSLNELLENKRKYNKSELTQIDLENLELVYTSIPDELIDNIEDIIIYALTEIGKIIKEGRDIYDFLERGIEFNTVGVVPKYMDEGFIILTTDKTQLYSYKMNKILLNNVKYRLVKTTLIPIDVTPFTTHQSIREEYILSLRNYNPITFGAFTKINVPIMTTLLPIIKRKILHYINTFS